MRETQGKLYLLFAFALAGTSVVTARFLSAAVGTFTITAVSLGLLWLLLFPFYGVHALRSLLTLSAMEKWLLFLQALFGIFAFRVFLLLGLTYTSAAEAGILTGVTPAITTALAFFLLKESMTHRTLAGIGCTITGIILLQGLLDGPESFTFSHLGGNLLVLAAAASEASFNIISRRQAMRRQLSRLQELHPMVQTLLVSAVAFILCLPPALGEQPLQTLARIGLGEWLALFWYGLFITALSFALFYAGVRRCSAYTTAAFSGFMPLSSVLLAVLLLGETMSGGQWAGALLVLLGVWLIGTQPSITEKGTGVICKHSPI